MSLKESERTLIQENLYALISNTRCTPDFLEKFKSHRVFSLADMEAITHMRGGWCDTDQAYQFYRRLLASNTSSSDVFELLLSALLETEQVAAYKILLAGGVTAAIPSAPVDDEPVLVESVVNIKLDLSPQLFKKGANFATPPDAITKFLKSPKDINVLVLECPEPNVTLARILDTLRVTLLVTSQSIIGHPSEPLYVFQFKEHTVTVEQLQSVITSLGKDSKLIILHSLGEELSLQNNLGHFVKTRDELRWEDLTPSFQTTLMEKVKLNCGFKVSLTSQMMSGNALLRLLTTDFNDLSSSHSLLGKICGDHIFPKIGSVTISEALLEDLGRIAMKDLFPQWEMDIFGESKYLDEPSLTRLVASSLLKQTFNQRFDYEFVISWMNHYFLGWFLSRNKRNRDWTSFCKTFLKVNEVFVGGSKSLVFENYVCTYFLNFHLEPNAQLLLDGWSDLGNAVLACLNGNLDILAKTLVPKLYRADANLVQQAVISASPAVVDLLLQRFAEMGLLLARSSSTGDTLLHLALRKGKLELASKLLFEHGFRPELVQKHMRNIIHSCVENTLDLSDAEVARRMEMVELLVGMDKTLLNEKFGQLKVPPLLSPRVHLNMIKALLQIGAEVGFASGKDPRKHLLHAVAVGRTPEQYHEVTSFFASNRLKFLLRIKDEKDLSPMHYAVFHTDLLDKTIQLYSENGVGLNEVCKNGRTILFYAVDKGRSFNFIMLLVNLGVDWRRKDVYRQTVLFRAVRRGNLEAIKYFANMGLDVNGTDHWGRSPLHKCFIRNTLENQAEVVQLLISLGAVVNKKDELGKSPLWWATKGTSKEQNKQDAVSLLKAYGTCK